MELPNPVKPALPEQSGNFGVKALALGVGVLAVGAAIGWSQRERLSGALHRLPYSETIGRLARTVSSAVMQPLLHKLHGNTDALTPDAAVEQEHTHTIVPVVRIVESQKIREERRDNPHDIPFTGHEFSMGIIRDVAMTVSQQAADTLKTSLDQQKLSNVDEAEGQRVVAQALQTSQLAVMEARKAGNFAGSNSNQAMGAVVSRLFQNKQGETYAAMAAYYSGSAVLLRKNEENKFIAKKVEFGDDAPEAIHTRAIPLQPGDVLINMFGNVLDPVGLDKIETFANLALGMLAQSIVQSAVKSDARLSDTPGRAQDKTVIMMQYLKDTPVGN